MNILLKGIGCFPLINACIKDPILYMYKLFTVSTRVLKKSGLVCVNFGAFERPFFVILLMDQVWFY